MKRFELIFTFIQLPLDYLMIILAGFSAYGLRYTELVTSIRPVLFNLNWQTYWPIVMIVSLGWLLIFIFSGLYSSDPNRKLSNELNRIGLACSTGFAGITIYVFFTLQKFDSRFLVLASWILSIIYVGGGRIALRLIKILFYKFGIGLRQTIIIGNKSIAQKIKNTFTNRPSLGYKLLSSYDHFTNTLSTEILTLKPDEIIFTDPKANEEETISAIEFANEHHITFKYSADLFSTISSNIDISAIAGIPIIELRRTPLTGWNRIIKRSIDIVLSIILIIIFSPIYIIIALAIFIETGRPIIYKNERVGQSGVKFFTLKFRSMYKKDCTGEQFGKKGEIALDKEEELIKTSSTKKGPVYKIKDDPRITKFGQFLRSWSLDELPQFFNVLDGSMSLVGPRPHQPREVSKYQKWQKTLLTIKPGITGLAQISGRSDLSFDEEAKLDTFYIEHWSLILDLIILIKTPFVVLTRKGAR